MITEKERTVMNLMLDKMNQHGLYDWRVSLSSKKRGVGDTNVKNKTIRVSRYLIKYGTEEEIMDTILHEIAHAIQWKRHQRLSHDWVWKRICDEIGARPERTKECQDYTSQLPSKYTLSCTRCGESTPIHRKLKSKYICGVCKGKYGTKEMLVLTQNY